MEPERHDWALPSASTITAILRRHGVEIGAFGGGVPAFCRFVHETPKDLWQMNFKGHVGLGDGARLHPFPHPGALGGEPACRHITFGVRLDVACSIEDERRDASR